MTTDRTGEGDPARTVELLWRHHREPPVRPGPRSKIAVDDVVAAGIALADVEGLEALTMRALAQRLDLPPMSLYRVVPDKATLLDLLVDHCLLAMPRRPWRARQAWRTRARRVAEENRALLLDHPWLVRVSTARPPLGPGQLARYDHELRAFDPTGLDDLTRDAALTHLLGFVRWSAETTLERHGGDAEWWSRAGPALARVVDPRDYPVAARVGSAAGAAQNSAFDADAAWTFGVERVLESIALLTA